MDVHATNKPKYGKPAAWVISSNIQFCPAKRSLLAVDQGAWQHMATYTKPCKVIRRLGIRASRNCDQVVKSCTAALGCKT